MATTGLSMAEHAQAVTDPAEAGRVIARQHHVGSFVQQDSHSPIAALGDAADIVDLPGLEVPRHQAEIAPTSRDRRNRSGASIVATKANAVLAYAGNGHQALAGMRRTGQQAHVTVDRNDRFKNGLAGSEQALHGS